MQADDICRTASYLLLFDCHTADDVCLSVLCSDIARNRNYCRTGSN